MHGVGVSENCITLKAKSTVAAVLLDNTRERGMLPRVTVTYTVLTHCLESFLQIETWFWQICAGQRGLATLSH